MTSHINAQASANANALHRLQEALSGPPKLQQVEIVRPRKTREERLGALLATLVDYGLSAYIVMLLLPVVFHRVHPSFLQCLAGVMVWRVVQVPWTWPVNSIARTPKKRGKR